MSLPHWEKYVFYGVILLNTIPVFCFDFFPTMDGPAHLYNVQLIRELLSDESFTGIFFEMRNIIVPNWFGHGILLFYGSFLSPSWAEKLMLITFMAALPLSFHYFLQRLKYTLNGLPQTSLAVYLIFPLSYSMSLHYGFYNFSFGLVFLFLTLGYFFHSYANMNNKKGVFLGVLLLFTYLSHFFVFGLLLVFILMSYIVLYFTKNEYRTIKDFFATGIRYIVYFSPALFLCAIYLSVFTLGGASSYIEKTELLNWLVHARPLIYFEENEFSKFFFFAIVIWSIILIFNYYKRKVFSYGAKLMFLFLGFMFVLYFLLPNETSSAGFISIRLLTLFFLFWIATISLMKVNRYFALSLVIAALFIHIKITDKFIKNGQTYSDLAAEIVDVSKLLKNNPIVLPINASNDWMKAHFSNYLGLEQSVVILDNYEASNSYFPVGWKEFSVERILEEKMGTCLKFDPSILPYYPHYNYIFILKGGEKVNDYHQLLEDKNWQNLYDSKNVSLWRLEQ